MRRKAYVVSALVLVICVIAFNNCGASGFKAAEHSIVLPSLQCKAMKALKPEVKVASKVSSSSLPAGREVAVVLDSECLRDSSRHGQLTKDILKIKNIALTPANSTVVSFAFAEAITGEELSLKASADQCVQQIDFNEQLQMLSVPSDPLYSQQRYLQVIKHADAVTNLFNSANGINQTVRIAVIDSGVDLAHPDLAALTLYDSNGRPLVLNGYDNTNNVVDPGIHGTHVAGLAAAVGYNGTGISGVLGKNVKLLPVKASNDGQSIDLAAVANGIIWATDTGAHVINMSLGGPRENLVFKAAINYAVSKGVFIAVAAGNSAQVLGVNGTAYPAMFAADFEGMISVGSLDAGSGDISFFSNRSPTYVDLLAPGSDQPTGILSTFPVNQSINGGYESKDVRYSSRPQIHGTSMASPIAAGAAAAVIALARSRGYNPSGAQVEELFAAALPSNSSFSNYSTGGRFLDFSALINKADADMGLSLASSTSRSLARGSVSIATPPQSQQVQNGSPLILSVAKAPGSSIFVDYQWYKNGARILGANDPTLEIPQAYSATAGKYKVELKAGSATVMSSEATVTVAGADGSTSPLQACP